MDGRLMPMAVEMGTGFAVAAVVPAAVLLSARSPRWAARWRRVSWRPALVLPAFAVLHFAVNVLLGALDPAWPVRAAATALLLAAAIPFWLPVLLPDALGPAGRCVYLFLAGPALDIAALWLIAMGHSGSGIAMIVGMLPVGFAAWGATWRWAVQEEKAAQADEQIQAASDAPAAEGAGAALAAD